MPEFESALAASLHPGRHGAGSGEPGLVLSERPLGLLVQLTGWRGSFVDAAATVLRRLGFVGVGAFDRAQEAPGGVAFRIAPERVLVRLADPAAWRAAAAGIDPAVTPVLDLSHARTLVSIMGAQAPDLLARLLPIDFDAEVLPLRGFVQSGLHGVGVLAHRLAGGFDLYLPRSYAASLWDLITESAKPFGYRVE